MPVEQCVLIKITRDLISARDRLKSLGEQVSATATCVDWTINAVTDLIKEGHDADVSDLMAAAAPDMADAILETITWQLTDFMNKDERKRCLDLLQASLSKATGTNGH